jgi:hypothetical protein
LELGLVLALFVITVFFMDPVTLPEKLGIVYFLLELHLLFSYKYHRLSILMAVHAGAANVVVSKLLPLVLVWSKQPWSFSKTRVLDARTILLRMLFLKPTLCANVSTMNLTVQMIHPRFVALEATASLAKLCSMQPRTAMQ